MTIALLVATPHAAHSGGMAEEFSAGISPRSASRWIGNQLGAFWDIDSRWQLRFDLSTTRAYSHEAGASHDDSYLGSLALMLAFDEHWSLRLSTSGTPVVTSHAAAALGPVDPLAGRALLDVDLRVKASWFTLGAGLDYSSNSDDVHSPSASLSVGETYFATYQEVIQAREPNASVVLDPSEAHRRCLSVCTSQLTPQSAQLAQFMVSASFTDTVDGDTDLSLDVSYYLYGDDPMKPGYFALATLEATTRGSAASAPLLRNTFSPSVTHRWGDLSTSVILSYTGCARAGFDVGASLAVNYKLALARMRQLGLHARLGGQSHTDDGYQLTRSGSLALGAQYSW